MKLNTILKSITIGLAVAVVAMIAMPVSQGLRKEIVINEGYIDDVPALVVEGEVENYETIVYDFRPLKGITSCNVVNKDVEIQRQEEAKQKALEEELARQEAARKEEEARIAAEKAEKEKQQLGDGSYI